MSKLLDIWRAGRVMRWHVNPHLCETRDPDDGHAARVTLMALSLIPDMSREGIIHALTHDLGEHATGDMSYMVKVKNPKTAAEIAEMERAAITSLGFNQPQLSEKEISIVKLCDWLDAWLWMAHHVPHLRNRSDWIEQKTNAEGLARGLGVWPQVSASIAAFEAEHQPANAGEAYREVEATA